MSDGPPVSCQTCEAPVKKVFHPVAVHFKGSGFYNTDYGTRKRSREKESYESKTKGESSSNSDSSKSDSSKSSSSDTKPAAKSESPKASVKTV